MSLRFLTTSRTVTTATPECVRVLLFLCVCDGKKKIQLRASEETLSYMDGWRKIKKEMEGTYPPIRFQTTGKTVRFPAPPPPLSLLLLRLRHALLSSIPPLLCAARKCFRQQGRLRRRRMLSSAPVPSSFSAGFVSLVPAVRFLVHTIRSDSSLAGAGPVPRHGLWPS